MSNICLSYSPFVPVEFCLWPLCKVCSHFVVQIFCILLFCLLDLPETELCWNLLCCWVCLLQLVVLDTFTLHIVRIYYRVQKLAYNIFLEGASLVAQLVKKIHLKCERPKFDPWIGMIPWRRAWQPTPVFLPGESHGQKSLAGYSPWSHTELDMTEWLSTAQYSTASS